MCATLTRPETALATPPALPERAGPARSRIVALVVASAVLLLTLSAMWIQVTFPSDGVQLLTGRSSWPPEGVPVAPIVASSPGPFRHGDIVVSVGDKSLESWAQALFDPGAAHPPLRVGQRLTYSILRDGHHQNATVTLVRYPLAQVLQMTWGTILFALTFALLALFIFFRRPRERLTAPLLVAASALCCVVLGSFSIGVTAILNGTAFWFFIATTIWADSLFLGALLHTVLLFPQPNPLATQRRWLVPATYAAPFLAGAFYLIVTRLLTPNTVAWLGTWESSQRAVGILFEVLVAAVILWTYRASSDEITRQKIRWVVFGGIVALVGTVLLWFIPLLVVGHTLLNVNVLGLVQLAFPICLAIAILRYRLFDIDTIINRAMVYGTLTAMLAAAYLVCVIVLESLARALTGQSQPHPLVIVVSTLAIAALIQPLRRRLQTTIDRRFYRRRYDAARTLQAFGATLRHEVDLPDLGERLVHVIDDTMRPAFISLWLRPHPHDTGEHGAANGVMRLIPANDVAPPPTAADDHTPDIPAPETSPPNAARVLRARGGSILATFVSLRIRH